VALVTLPFHGARTPDAARFSGEHFAVPDVARLAESVRRAIHEVRALTLWLRETTGQAVGLIGLSLGGYLTALSAGLYDDLDFAIPMVPPVCIGDLAWRFFQRSRRAAETAYAYDELRRNYRIHSPLAHPLRTPAERCLIVAGRGDRIVPPEHPHALWRHWDRPAIHWFSGGHLSPFGRDGIAAAVLRHLSDLDLVER
jgi:pimeloyl-ACP methyl ester carboxylesterase